MHPQEVAQMFSQIARRYDLANRVLSLNRDRLWRRELVRQAAPRPSERLLDVCTGTGDVVLEFARVCPDLQIVGLDLSEEMLRVAREKFARWSLDRQVRLVQGNALELPFADDSFEIATMAFGLRNLPDRSRGLREIYRVLSPGGRLLILEFALPQSLLVRSFYLLYLRYFLPYVGGLLSGSRTPYEYLRDSILSFPQRAQILEELYAVGFRPVGYRDLSLGIATLYWGGKVIC
ncbi:MAG: bifunctional demethylmenaquinone methyltransferase/2-methoxy-6-polyprenyl-1,4-benzoquinol methylase UbiE [Candidatus Bipolaricaulota bacterium]|nr:bifunctional demethylmenaquinone methyltransferase/2-methoxy-6-polyprenyl-1,4-benzoquinol methylase UbiE [Candidatus Bipolaricaulota bacterium]MDW8030302.1 bifunctional demethylmenaquinone methyltransferase/2-methoxy-6-polyprenyl-1,4-benzoquinol methylase UbiE [Candidatus Bipolaricaulota bacterium]